MHIESLIKKWIHPTSIEDAKQIQNEMLENLLLEDTLSTMPLHIAGMDVSNILFDPKKKIYGAVVVLSYPSFEILEIQCQSYTQTFPYIPGFLAFREAPPLIKAFSKLSKKPDLLFVDGHGICHPKGIGIASHIGIMLDIPTIGVAKSILVGKAESFLGLERGSQAPLIYKEKVVGMLYRSKKRSNPLIISPGHKITLEKAVEFVEISLKGYRLCEPTRHAHVAANAFRTSSIL